MPLTSWINTLFKRKNKFSLAIFFLQPKISIRTKKHKQKLNKNIQFVNVTVEQYGRDLGTDTLIYGLTSDTIRQHLLERQKLILNQACETTRALE